MLHPSISRKNIVLNGIYPNEFAVSNGQTAPTAFKADQGDVLTITHSESFAVMAVLLAQTGYTFVGKVNDTPIAETNVLTTFEGGADSKVVLGAVGGKPIVAPFLISFSDLPTVSAKGNNFTLMLGEGKEIYNFVVLADNTVKLYVRNGNAWDLINTFPFGHAIIATDTVGYRVTDEKIELLLNDVSVWEKARNWTVLLSSDDLGVLGTPPPYNFGQAATLTIGKNAGPFTLSIYDQQGVSLKIDQGILVTTDNAPVMTTNNPDILIPVLAATVLANQNSAAAGTTATPTMANGVDWGKILTYGGIALAGIVVVAGLLWAIRGKK